VLLLVAADPPDRDSAGDAAARLGVELSPEAPTSIRAEELTASRGESGEDLVVFRGNVQVEQGSLGVSCDLLEATYPESRAGGPRRYVARGNVRVRQQESEASCAEATFDASRNEILCRGGDRPATLRRGADVVEGLEILFDLGSSKVRVTGAVVRVQPRPGREP
jgi:lipopolysaccharide transport protein LptA